MSRPRQVSVVTVTCLRESCICSAADSDGGNARDCAVCWRHGRAVHVDALASNLPYLFSYDNAPVALRRRRSSHAPDVLEQDYLANARTGAAIARPARDARLFAEIDNAKTPMTPSAVAFEWRAYVVNCFGMLAALCADSDELLRMPIPERVATLSRKWRSCVQRLRREGRGHPLQASILRCAARPRVL